MSKAKMKGVAITAGIILAVVTLDKVLGVTDKAAAKVSPMVGK